MQIWQILKVTAGGLVVVAYPFMIYFLLAQGVPWFGAALVSAVLLWRIYKRGFALDGLMLLVILMAVSGLFLGPAFVAKMAPLFIYASLLTIFVSSLKTTPLIEQFARFDFPELPPEIVTYCRNLTRVWAGFFVFNIVVCIALAVRGDDKLWALYNGLIVYFLIFGLMAGEYIWRRFRFPDIEIPSIRQTIENIRANGQQIWGSKDGPASSEK